MTINLSTIMDTLDELLYFGSGLDFTKEIEVAKAAFSRSDIETDQLSTDTGFNDWYIHNYEFENKLLLTDLYRREGNVDSERKKCLDAIANSILSVFEIRGDEGAYFLKDLFTNRDYAIENQDDLALMNKNNLHFTRIYPGLVKFIVMPDTLILGANFKEILVKTFMEQYNQYTKLVGVAEVEEFAYEHPLVMYKIVHILEDLESESVYDDEEYRVFQSVYLYQDLNAIRKRLDEEPSFECSLAEDNDYVYKLFETDDHKVIISEIVLSENRLEAECLNDHDLQATKRKLEAVLGDQIAFLHDEVLDFDDLL